MTTEVANTESSSPEHQQKSHEDRRAILVVVLALVGVVAATAVITLLSDDPGSEPEVAAAPAATRIRGVACPDLQAAADLLVSGDREGFVDAIERAGLEARDALQRSGVVFGRPEHAALELSFLVNRNDMSSQGRLEHLLTLGVAACPQNEN